MSGKKSPFTAEENDALRKALAEYRAKHELTQAAMGELLGIEQQNVGAIERSKQGLNRGTANRLAGLLNHRDAESFLISAGVLAELEEPAPALGGGELGHDWGERDRAVRHAQILKIDPVAVEAVVARYKDDTSRQRAAKWWVNKFLDEEKDRLAERAERIPVPPASDVNVDRATKPPETKRKRRAHG